MHLAYRWFSRLGLEQEIPAQKPPWSVSEIGCVSQSFREIVQRCLEAGLVEGRTLVVDGTLVGANAAHDSADTWPMNRCDSRPHADYPSVSRWHLPTPVAERHEVFPPLMSQSVEPFEIQRKHQRRTMSSIPLGGNALKRKLLGAL